MKFLSPYKIGAVVGMFAVTGMVAFAQQPPAPTPATPFAANAQAVQGNVASGATDAGNPVKVGGRFNTSKPTLTNGQRGDIQLNSRGDISAYLNASNGSGINAGSPSDNQALGAQQGLQVLSTTMINNGAGNWDGVFECTSTAAVNVTAAATTEIVPLTGGQTIRVCSMALTMSTAGTAQIVNGTGANCGTGTANITGAMNLGTGTPLAMGSGLDAILRAPISNALCISAVTGNVTGFVTYAKF